MKFHFVVVSYEVLLSDVASYEVPLSDRPFQLNLAAEVKDYFRSSESSLRVFFRAPGWHSFVGFFAFFM